MVSDDIAAHAGFLKNARVNYALLDAARDPGVRAFIIEHAPDGQSLYAGFDEDLIDVAPYLVALTPERIDELVPWAWGNNWGIFIRSDATIDEVRRHFRTFLIVDLEGEQVYFRFYDPRVLHVYLPTCNPSEWREFFGAVNAFVTESPTGDALLFERERFRGTSGQAQ